MNWQGRFSVHAETILSLHCAQCGLSTISVMLARWIEFIKVHILYPIDFSVFLSLLQKLVKAIQNNSVTQEEVNEYLECNMLQIIVMDADFCLTIKNLMYH